MTLSFQPDDDADLLAKLLPYATDVQANYVEAIRVHGSGKAAARALGVSGDTVNKSIRALRRMGALKGVAPECGMTESVPDGFRLKGRSVLRKLDPVTGQKVEVLAWDKISADDERRAEMIKEWVEHLTVGCRGLSPIVPAPAYTMKSLLVSYKFGDPHFGMCSAPEDGGDTFDVDEADRITRAGIYRLVQVSPASSTCIVEVIGDAMHANDGSALTPGHKNPLDIDPRGFRYALLKSAEAWRYVILRALEKHDKVIVWFLEGNHDPEAAGAIALALSFYFDNEPRVEIDLSPAVFRYLRFGQCLLGAHHGDKVKMAELPLLMAVDRPADWGATSFRYITTGHIHHDVVKEIQTVRIESLRTLSPKDPYHTSKGYRSLRDTRSVVYHEDHGEIERYTVGAALLAA